jgi:hypothetical protein
VRTIRAPASGDPGRKRFTFTVTVADRDATLLDRLHGHLGEAGSIYRYPARVPGWQPTASLQVSSLRDHVAATIPFAERFLLPVGRKAAQFRNWRDELETYRRDRAEARLPSRPRRARHRAASGLSGRGAKGVCRRHYYAVFRR